MVECVRLQSVVYARVCVRACFSACCNRHERASTNGSTQALHAMGIIFSSSEIEGEYDPKKAFRWFTKVRFGVSVGIRNHPHHLHLIVKSCYVLTYVP